MKISKKLVKNIRKTNQDIEKDVYAPLTYNIKNKTQRLNNIVGIWVDKAETINPVDFVKKQRIARF